MKSHLAHPPRIPYYFSSANSHFTSITKKNARTQNNLIKTIMPQVQNVNTTDIVDAIHLACHTMSNIFNADDNDIPFFRIIARPAPFLGISCEEHVPGRHLNALLHAADVADISIDEDVVDKHAQATFYSYSGPVPVPLGRVDGKGDPIHFVPHHIREGFHALAALAQFRNCPRARQLAAASIAWILANYDLESTWDYDLLERKFGLSIQKEQSFVSGLARAIGPLIKYYKITGYGPALELAIALKEKLLREVYNRQGDYNRNTFGTHAHSVTCVMSSLAQLADLTSDAVLMGYVKAFYDNGLWEMRDALGWSVESTSPDSSNPDEGEMNNTGDIVETALILGRWGYAHYYHDAERILRSHLLPSQLRDVSFVEAQEPDGSDGLHNVAERMRGSFGFPAPFGHEPLENKRIRFNTDVVGGTVGSLCEVLREMTRFDQSGHWVNLLFDCDTPHLRVESPYTHPALCVHVKRPAPLFVRIPPWVDRHTLRVDGIAAQPHFITDYAFIAEPPANRPITFAFPLAEQEITLNHRTRDIRVRLRGDAVAAMQNFGADLTFFDPLD